MTTIPFDTLEFASELIQEGIPSNQANVIAKAVCKRLSNSNAAILGILKLLGKI